MVQTTLRSYLFSFVEEGRQVRYSSDQKCVRVEKLGGGGEGFNIPYPKNLHKVPKNLQIVGN